MFPNNLACFDEDDNEATAVFGIDWVRKRLDCLFSGKGIRRICTAPFDEFHLGEDGFLAIDVDGDIQSLGFRMIRHSPPILHAQEIGAMSNFDSRFWNHTRPISHFTCSRIDVKLVLVAQVTSRNELSSCTV